MSGMGCRLCRPRHIPCVLGPTLRPLSASDGDDSPARSAPARSTTVRVTRSTMSGQAGEDSEADLTMQVRLARPSAAVAELELPPSAGKGAGQVVLGLRRSTSGPQCSLP